MKIYRVTYEEIDTDDKWNEKENIKMIVQCMISPYELAMYDEKYQTEYKELVKNKVFREITKRVFPNGYSDG